MGYLTDSVRALAVTMRNVFRRPTTVHYPAQKRERAERYRNSFALVHDEHGEEACIGCDLCAQICPSDVITVEAGPKIVSEGTGKKRGSCKDFTLDLNACIFCELCVQVCPVDAIVMLRAPERPAFSREDLVLTMPRLYENEKEKPVTWGTGTLLREMQDPKRGQPKPARKKKAANKAPEKKDTTPEPAAAEKTNTTPEPEPAAAAKTETKAAPDKNTEPSPSAAAPDVDNLFAAAPTGGAAPKAPALAPPPPIVAPPPAIGGAAPPPAVARPTAKSPKKDDDA